MEIDEYRKMVIEFVLECRKSGHFLPYTDYQVIDSWVQEANSPDDLVMVLGELLPEYFTKNQSGPPPLLAGIDKRVRSYLKERKP